MKKSKKTEITVSKIIDAAMNEFGKNGYIAGTVNNICKTGINKGLLYHNFDGKDDLYLICLRKSCAELMQYIQKQNGEEDLGSYMVARMEFINRHPNEAHIFFEALLNPPAHLSEKIRQTLAEYQKLNEKIYSEQLDTLTLREGISRDDAVSYFHLMQLMLNGYFSTPVFQNMTLQKKTEMHETLLPKIYDCMLYGIAKEER